LVALVWWHASGLPTPRRRTLASGILPFGSLGTAFAPPSWLSLGSYAGSRGMGNPSLVKR